MHFADAFLATPPNKVLGCYSKTPQLTNDL